MAENWIKLEKGKIYEVIGGVSYMGEVGEAVEIRKGSFGRMWALIEWAPEMREWFRASHLTPIEEKSRYAEMKADLSDSHAEGLAG